MCERDVEDVKNVGARKLKRIAVGFDDLQGE